MITIKQGPQNKINTIIFSLFSVEATTNVCRKYDKTIFIHYTIFDLASAGICGNKHSVHSRRELHFVLPNTYSAVKSNCHMFAFTLFNSTLRWLYEQPSL